MEEQGLMSDVSMPSLPSFSDGVPIFALANETGHEMTYETTNRTLFFCLSRKSCWRRNIY